MPKIDVLPKPSGVTPEQAERQREMDEEALIATSMQTRAFTTAEEWANYADNLLASVRELEGQLKDPTIRTDNYWQWRKRARYSWMLKVSQYRHAKKMIVELKQADRLRRIRLEEGTPEDLLFHLNGLVKSWVGQGVVTLRPPEARQVAVIEAYFNARFDRPERPPGSTPGQGGFASNAKLDKDERLGRMGPELDPEE